MEPDKKVWKLMLNDMRGNSDVYKFVAWSESKEVLLNWYNSLKVEEYSEIGAPSFACHGKSHQWNKCFKKDSPLEWYNPLDYPDGRELIYAPLGVFGLAGSLYIRDENAAIDTIFEAFRSSILNEKTLDADQCLKLKGLVNEFIDKRIEVLLAKDNLRKK